MLVIGRQHPVHGRRSVQRAKYGIVHGTTPGMLEICDPQESGARKGSSEMVILP